MSVSVVERRTPPGEPSDLPTPRWSIRDAIPTILVALNAVAFVVVRPDVNDLWAARARASAVSHGVGLSYWFSWFGGSTPGNYSVFTPWLSARIGTELVGALAAVSVVALATLLLRGTARPRAASAVAGACVLFNLWSGRIPFLVGAAFAVGALLAVRGRRRALAVLLTLLSVVASPVTGAFLALGLSGTFLTTSTRAYRPILAWVIAAAGLGLIAVAVLFGTPGPESFDWLYVLEVFGGLILLRLTAPPDHLRTTLWLTALVTAVLFLIPNGMGSNIARLVFFCLPVAAVALASAGGRVLALLMAPLLVAGGAGTVLDLVHADRPVSSASYYDALADRLDGTPGLGNCRVEVVDHGAHAGYYALLDHVLLARGWETQENSELNGSLDKATLDATTYKVWLDNNAVCYVALPTESVSSFPEYALVARHRPTYLSRVWSDKDWQLFQVQDPTPIVAAPAEVVAYGQAYMTVRIPCRCTVDVRVRWSQYLGAVLLQPGTDRPAQPAVHAQVTVDPAGWIRITTPRPGSYRLSGNLSGLLH